MDPDGQDSLSLLTLEDVLAGLRRQPRPDPPPTITARAGEVGGVATAMTSCFSVNEPVIEPRPIGGWLPELLRVARRS